jgi:hypothetical protein
MTEVIQAIKPTKATVFVPAPNGLAKILFTQGAYSELLIIPGQVFQAVKTNPASREISVTIWPLSQYAVEFTVPMPEAPKEEAPVAPTTVVN